MRCYIEIGDADRLNFYGISYYKSRIFFNDYILRSVGSLEAATCLRDAEESLGRLSREDPEAVDIRYWLAVAKQELGRVSLARGQSTAASTLLRSTIATHEQAQSNSRAGRDLLALAWSYHWLCEAELQAGRPEAIPLLQGRLVEVLEAFKGQLLIGSVLPQQSRELGQIDDLVEPLLASAQPPGPSPSPQNWRGSTRPTCMTSPAHSACAVRSRRPRPTRRPPSPPRGGRSRVASTMPIGSRLILGSIPCGLGTTFPS
jgi:hypothetical protein